MCTERKNKGGQPVLNLYTLDQWMSVGKSAKSEIHHTFARPTFSKEAQLCCGDVKKLSFEIFKEFSCGWWWVACHISHKRAYWMKALIYERFLAVYLVLCGFLSCILYM